jgi:hypothetical protein
MRLRTPRMNQNELQKILADPEIQRLMKANGLTPPPEAKIEIDPKLVRQTKQLLALYGGGTFGEQLDATFRTGCAHLTFALGIMVLIGVLGIIIYVVTIVAYGIRP